MKQKIYSILLTALLGMTGMNAWAQDYEISSAQDLADFASAVNSGEFEANAILTADIDMSELTDWTAIGDWGGISGTASACYKGHFDGQGHTIKNFNFTSTHNYYGIFGVVSTGCLIENLIVKGTITTNIATAGVVGYARDATPTLRNIHSYLKINNTRAGSRLGGILGTAHNGTIVVDRCTYSGTLDGNDAGGSGNYGGIVGYENNNSGAHLRVTNCLFDGELKNSAATPGNCTFGGMVGYVGASPDVTITNCLSLGKLQSAITGLFYGAVKHNTCSIINSYYQKQESTYTINGAASGAVTPTTQQVTEVDETKLMSGEICFRLNESVSGGTNWFQTLVDDDYPFPYNGDVHDPVYANGSFICDGVTPKEGSTVVYSNTNSSIVDPHNFADGFCTVCNAFDATYMTANAEGIFEIGTPAQLKWFAVYVNQVEASANAILTANIDLSSIEWTPIGKGVYYGGTFDGQGFTVSNLTYVGSGDCNGLFGGVKDATVKNFSINGSLVCAGSWTGAIGRAENATISNVHSALTIETPATGVFHHAGGVVGGSYNPTTVDRCSFSGTLTVNAESHDCFGGIMGYTTDYCTVKNCINYGTVSFAKNNCYAGGIIGYINSTACNGTHNCLNIGIVEYTGEGDPSYSGAIVGRLRGNAPALWGYSYYLAGSAVNASGENQIPTNYEVTAAQLANGEAAAKLAPYIRQNIGTDAMPVLDPTHNVVAEITAADYATLYVPDTDITIPTGIEAFAGYNDGTYLQLTAINDAIAADEAVVLKGTAGIYSFVPTTGATKAATNELKGTAEDIEADGKYVLAMPSGEPVGFYKTESGTIKAGKAYLEVSGGSGVKGFTFAFGDDDPTSIKDLNDLKDSKDVIFNLAGQRMNKIQKGINIVDGKKILF